jgi:hypothetical protein
VDEDEDSLIDDSRQLNKNKEDTDKLYKSPSNIKQQQVQSEERKKAEETGGSPRVRGSTAGKVSVKQMSSS